LTRESGKLTIRQNESPGDRNDEILDRIYIGRRFKNDTERLEKLFELYTKMTAQQTPSKKPVTRKG
jgi:hypothetical protein